MSQKYISLEGLQVYTNKLKDEGTTKKIFGYNIWDTPAQNIELSNSFSMNGTTLNLNAASASTLGGVKIGGSVTGEYANLGVNGNDNIALPISNGAPLQDIGQGLELMIDSTTLGTNSDTKLRVLRAPIANDAYIDKTTESFDQITTGGVYNIGTSTSPGPWPIQDYTDARGRMFVIKSNNSNNTNEVITQIFMLNNNVGGEGNVYIRSCQQGTWRPWAKLQTNVEVGLIDQTKMDDLTDNGIYSGILSSTGETFVIICINNYAIAQQVGIQHISHLKYSLVVGTGEIKVEKRTRDAYGIWTEWENISGNNNGITEIPIATSSTIGGIKITGDALGSSVAINNASATTGKYYPVQVTTAGTAVVNVPWSTPTATSSTLGGIKVTGNALGSSVTINSASTTEGKYYPVQMTHDNKAVVNVPWTSSSSTTSVTTLATGTTTIATLAKNEMTLVKPGSATNLTISAFASPTASVVNNYGLTIQNIPSSSYTIAYPTNKTIKWANGIEPFFTGGETLEIIFTTIDSGTTYTATWTKYF